MLRTKAFAQLSANMARHFSEKDLQEILDAVLTHPNGLSAQQIHDSLETRLPRRTLQYRLRFLVDSGRLQREGAGRAVRYRSASPKAKQIRATFEGRPATMSVRLHVVPVFSESAEKILEYVSRPLEQRRPVGYDREFLESYRPNESFYFSAEERIQLTEIGRTGTGEQLAGTHARQVLDRLLIDLSWNSSRLEGNTYSLLDTELLLAQGEQAEGKDLRETQMILNHKEAIGFLVGAPQDIGFNHSTFLNLHALLAQNLLGDPEATGRLRRRGVGIGGSVFHPLGSPQVIEDYFGRVLAIASKIEDPFEQSLFIMVQLPYLQPFEDVNKRVSRLGANIPLIRSNLSPLSFENLPRDTYTKALLGVYELNRIELLREVFIWAYSRSAARYSAMRQSLGEPDPFRLKHRAALGELIRSVVRPRLGKQQAAAHIRSWVQQNIDGEAQGRFRDVAERELTSLHEGNYARYRISLSEFSAWQRAWAR